MSHLVANLLSLPLPKPLRRRVRRSLVQFRPCDWFAYRRFERGEVRENSVLLIETNDCHGEVTAGTIGYFRDLGYAVDVLVNSRILEEDPFCRLDLADVGVWSCYFGAFKWFFGGNRILKYRHVLLMSSAGYRYIDGSDAAPIVLNYPSLTRVKSLFVVEHELRDLDRFGERELLKRGHVLTLGHFRDGVFFTSLRIGPVKRRGRGKTAVFVTVGAVDVVRKNHRALLQAVSTLAREGLDFRVVVIGGGSVGTLPEEVRDRIEITGRVDYPTMFNRVEEADFILPLLDPANPDHERYITTGITGSYLLVCEFMKVPVIDPHFAEFYGYDDGNAVLATDLADGMRRAIGMSGSEYATRRDAIEALSARLKEESLENFRRILSDGCEGGCGAS